MHAVNTDARSATDSPMTRPLRVGVIGANPNRSWAKDSHIPALRSLENVQLAAVATTSRASADAAAATFGVRGAYDGPLALITASDIDIVSVCVRVPYHQGRSGITAMKGLADRLGVTNNHPAPDAAVPAR